MGQLGLGGHAPGHAPMPLRMVPHIGGRQVVSPQGRLPAVTRHRGVGTSLAGSGCEGVRPSGREAGRPMGQTLKQPSTYKILKFHLCLVHCTLLPLPSACRHLHACFLQSITVRMQAPARGAHTLLSPATGRRTACTGHRATSCLTVAPDPKHTSLPHILDRLRESLGESADCVRGHADGIQIDRCRPVMSYVAMTTNHLG